MDQRPYDHRSCQSLFGYAAAVHHRSGGVCQLCGCGRDRLDFDFWRQLTVEHLIGESQGGYLRSIQRVLLTRFQGLTPADVRRLADRIDELNTITACSFCNATTSRDRAPTGMNDLLATGPDDPEALIGYVRTALEEVLVRKRAAVEWKLVSVRRAYDLRVAPELRRRRSTEGSSIG
jgi:hypothetical protein